jgi:hypothetical protein
MVLKVKKNLRSFRDIAISAFPRAKAMDPESSAGFRIRELGSRPGMTVPE